MCLKSFDCYPKVTHLLNPIFLSLTFVLNTVWLMVCCMMSPSSGSFEIKRSPDESCSHTSSFGILNFNLKIFRDKNITLKRKKGNKRF